MDDWDRHPCTCGQCPACVRKAATETAQRLLETINIPRSNGGVEAMTRHQAAPYLAYLIRSGGVPLQVFLDDHRPVGGEVINDLLAQGWAEENLAGNLVVSGKGMKP